jgi:hypothetical protein
VTRRLLLVAAALAVLVSAATAFAASLTVTSSRLTSFSGATSVPTTTCTINPAADSYVSNALLDGNSNFGGATLLHVSGGGTDKRTFLRFDLSSCSPAIPTTAEVKSASLRLVLTTAPGQSRTYAAHLVSASWVEGSITFNNQPGIGTSSGTVVTGTTNGVTLVWTVTADVQAFANTPSSNNGWRIADSDESGVLGSQEGRFASRESASNKPQLVVVYYP